jgi:hypothetical protein
MTLPNAYSFMLTILLTFTILNGIPPHIPPNIATRAHSFYIKLMHQCLQLEPNKRPNAAEIIGQLKKVEEQLKEIDADGSMIGDTGSTIEDEPDSSNFTLMNSCNYQRRIVIGTWCSTPYYKCVGYTTTVPIFLGSYYRNRTV